MHEFLWSRDVGIEGYNTLEFRLQVVYSLLFYGGEFSATRLGKTGTTISKCQYLTRTLSSHDGHRIDIGKMDSKNDFHIRRTFPQINIEKGVSTHHYN